MSVRGVAASAFNRLPASTRRTLLHRLGRFAPWEEQFDLTPPARAEGEEVGPPDFVGIGAQKAGTTWWYELIASHPQVSSRSDVHKERHFLTRFATARFGPEEIAAYHGWFPRPLGAIAGEWTPDYLDCPWVPHLLARAAPEVRLLVMLRDPVERLCSGLAHGSRNRPGGAGGATSTITQAVTRGFYHQALWHWWEIFPDNRFLVLQYERCVEDPAGQLAATYRFLGLDESHVPTDLRQPVSATRTGKPELDRDTRRRLVEMYTPDVLELTKRLPQIDLALWVNFTEVTR